MDSCPMLTKKNMIWNDYEDDDDDEQDESIHESDADDDLVSESYSGTVDSEADDEVQTWFIYFTDNLVWLW